MLSRIKAHIPDNKKGKGEKQPLESAGIGGIGGLDEGD